MRTGGSPASAAGSVTRKPGRGDLPIGPRRFSHPKTWYGRFAHASWEVQPLTSLTIALFPRYRRSNRRSPMVYPSESP
ncbi:hypothetical protein BHM03_00039552 [Ensete ventricosum]|nr:hypothetical protein BHM03_00039552 [Ensete ventricosum]